MSRTPKINRVWNKQEKRIVRLLYRKGLLPVDISMLYWESYKPTNKKFKNKGSNFSWSGYCDEVYYCTYDYWGECIEHPIVDEFIETTTWNNVPDCVMEDCDDMWKAYSQSTFQYKGRKWLIKYLSSLATIRCDSNINKALKIKKI